MNLQRITDELAFFAPGVLRVNPPADAKQVASAEGQLGVTFPPSFRLILAQFNGGHLLTEPLLGVPPIRTSLDLVRATWEARAHWGGNGWSHDYVQVGDDTSGNIFVMLLDRLDDRDEAPVAVFDTATMRLGGVVASEYLHFVWFLIQDLKWSHGPDGRPFSRQTITWTPTSVVVRPEAPSPWRFNEAWMLANDPGLARRR